MSRIEHQANTKSLTPFWRRWSRGRARELRRRGQSAVLAKEQAEFEASGRQLVDETSGRKAALNGQFVHVDAGDGRTHWYVEYLSRDVPEEMRESSAAASFVYMMPSI